MRTHKFNARKTEVDDILFDSGGEANRYLELKYMQMAGEISDLQLQPMFELQDGFRDNAGKKRLPIKYKADFQYIEDDQVIVEDFKGYGEDPVWRIKKKMFLFRYPQYILRVTGG